VRLELTRRGDYAIRAMLHLARTDAPALSAPGIAAATQIPARFVGQVMGDLARAGLVSARIGRRGGYQLARPAAGISLLQIVEAVEGDTRRKRCVLSQGACTYEHACDVHEFFAAAQDALISRLSESTLAAAAA
jgi:Rrf2 family protein